MKFCVWLVAFLLAVAQVKSDFKETIHKIDMACREETHVTEKDIKDFFDGVAKGEPKEELKCHIKCLMEKQGHWKNGGFDSEAAMQQMQEMPELKGHQDKINKIMQECKDKKGSSDCDTAYLITKCAIDRNAGAM